MKYILPTIVAIAVFTGVAFFTGVLPLRQATGETFGYTTEATGGAWDSIFDSINSSKFTLSENGDVSSITVWLENGSSNELVKCAIYDSSKNLVTNGTTEERTINGGAGDWFIFTFGTEPSLTAGDYYLVVWGNGGDFSQNENGTIVDANGAGDTASDASGYNGFPASITAGTANFYISIYATYTPSGGASAPSTDDGGFWVE